MTRSRQLDLLNPAPDQSRLPEGVRYAEGILSEEQESDVARFIARLDLHPFSFRGYAGNRRTASFGWRYDFNGGGLQKAEPMPSWLLSCREAAAAFAGIDPDRLEHVLVTEYRPGAGIGWHRDRPQFGIVAALSLLGPCRMRFRRKTGERWERREQVLAPRSAYVLDGPGRTDWEHSIPSAAALRYSLTFRTLNMSVAATSTRPVR